MRYGMFVVGVPFMGFALVASILSPAEMLFKPGGLASGIGLFMLGGGFWQYAESSRVILQNGLLSRKIFWITWWRIPVEKVHVRRGSDPQGQYKWSVLRISDRTRRRKNYVGAIPYRQFLPSDIARLLEALGQPLNL
jgi:hypothetical protein